MSEAFLDLTLDQRREVLGVAVERSDRSATRLEKDLWVVWVVEQLFNDPEGEHLVFKGGTSLSKAYGILDRFSEDVDLTYYIGQIAPDLLEKAPYPVNTSQRAKWRDTITARMCDWIDQRVIPPLNESSSLVGLDFEISREGDDRVGLRYEPPLEEWMQWAWRSRIDAFVRLGDTIANHIDAILTTLEHRLSNALVEAFNTRIGLINRRAYGFHSSQTLIALAMLSCGDCRPALPGRAR